MTVTLGDSNYLAIMNDAIDPSQSTFTVQPRKLEITIAKAHKGPIWRQLEKETSSSSASVIPGPQYPSSNKKKHNWDQLNKDLEVQFEKEKPEGDEALNKLFKQIYKGADENPRRAMMKSFQTSGGTVLSTNWDEVASKDYEGADRPEPPKGQDWKKPEF